jgi:hypothetical protein
MSLAKLEAIQSVVAGDTKRQINAVLSRQIVQSGVRILPDRVLRFGREVVGRRPEGVRPGADFMNLLFGRKVSGQIFIVEFWTVFHPKNKRHLFI